MLRGKFHRWQLGLTILITLVTVSLLAILSVIPVFAANPAILGDPEITSPTPDIATVLSGSSETFGWTDGTSGSTLYLYVGTTLGAKDIFEGGVSGTSETVSGLPTDGSDVYVRLWWRLSGEVTWNGTNYSYKAATVDVIIAATPELTSPTPDIATVLSGSSETFGWTDGTSGSTLYLYVGTTLGAKDIFEGGVSGTSETVSGLPTDGSDVYVRLWWRLSGEVTWDGTNYSYKAATVDVIIAATPELTSPTPDIATVLSGSSETFGWTDGTSGSTLYLYVGTTLGAKDIFEGGVSGTSETVSGLPTDGSDVYVRLWWRLSGEVTWDGTNYSYIAAFCQIFEGVEVCD